MPLLEYHPITPPDELPRTYEMKVDITVTKDKTAEARATLEREDGAKFVGTYHVANPNLGFAIACAVNAAAMRAHYQLDAPPAEKGAYPGQPQKEKKTVDGISYTVTRTPYGSTVRTPCHCFGHPERTHSVADCPWRKKRERREKREAARR